MSEIHGPRQVVLVTCRHKGKDNVITLAWHSPLSFYPEMYGILISRKRYSYDIIKKSKVFCVNFISADMKDLAVKCGTTSGRDLDKFIEFGLEKEECKTIDCCRIKDVLGYIECELVDEIETGDHVIFVGKSTESRMIKPGRRLYHITNDKFKIL